MFCVFGVVEERCWSWPVSYNWGCLFPLIQYMTYCLLQNQSPRCRQIHGNKAPHQITNIRFGLVKQNKAICEWLGFSVRNHVIIILTHWHQLGGRSESLPTPRQAFSTFEISCAERPICIFVGGFFSHCSGRLSGWPPPFFPMYPCWHLRMIVHLNSWLYIPESSHMCQPAHALHYISCLDFLYSLFPMIIIQCLFSLFVLKTFEVVNNVWGCK